MGSLVFESTSYSGITGCLIGGSNIFSIENPLDTSPEHNYKVWRSVFFLLFVEIQVIWRLYESLYVFHYSSTTRMHVFGYLTGLLVLLSSLLTFSCEPLSSYRVDFINAAVMGNLREVKEQADDYQIPHCDWFEIVSSPHYLAELVIYAGLLVASGGLGPTVWLLFAFVVMNLTFAARETHG